MLTPILTNTQFADDLHPVSGYVKNKTPFAKGWKVDYRNKEDAQSIRIEPYTRGGVLVNITNAIGWVRVFQEIPAEAIPSGKQCDIEIETEGGKENRISWVSILSVGVNGKLGHHTKIADQVDCGEGKTFRAKCTIAPAVENTKYYFVLHFEKDVKNLIIRKCSLHHFKAQKLPARAKAPDADLSVGVVAWDMTHNPVGRAYLVADLVSRKYNVELLGPSFPFYGKGIWPPIADCGMTMKTFEATDFRSFVTGAIDMVKANQYDVVHVCKPRFPSLFIGLLYKLIWDIPVVADVDDYELSFFNTTQGMSLEELLSSLEEDDWKTPYNEKWTRFANDMVELFDSVAVSNPTLMHEFGGYIVRHARDEDVFDPEAYDREQTREEFGLKPSDKAIVFLGTPRPHKGIFEIADALEKIDDPDAVLCIIGSITDKRTENEFKKYSKARILFHPNQPFSRIAEIINIADVVCILQDPKHPIAQHQIPAKLTDALSMGVPVIASKVPPLLDVIAAKAIAGIDDNEDFVNTLRAFLSDDALRAHQGQMGRNYYNTEFSYQVNVQREALAIQDAIRRKKPLDLRYVQLIDRLQNQLGDPIDVSDRMLMMERFYGHGVGDHIDPSKPINMAFFWKQNDSGIYGRRQDMLLKYFARDSRVGNVVHFDAPIGMKKLMTNVQTDDAAKFKQGNLVVRNTVERFLKMQDEPGILRRTFIYNDGGGDTFMGQKLPLISEYPEFVERCLREAEIVDNALAWVCPVCFEFPQVQERIQFPMIVSDLIDNHLAWDLKPQYAEKVKKNYEDIAGNAKLAFANCEAVQRDMAVFNDNIHLVPNGTEVFPPDQAWGNTPLLAGMERPILGYVGNLSDRVNIPLISRIAEENPEWNIVLIGSAHLNNDVFVMKKYPNVHFLGVQPYDQALHYIAAFDVAMIPHEVNKMTEAMNPLKLYVYSSIGTPIVATALPNMGDFADSVHIAESDDEFIEKIRKVLKKRMKPRRNDKAIRQHSWERRVDAILAEVIREVEAPASTKKAKTKPSKAA